MSSASKIELFGVPPDALAQTLAAFCPQKFRAKQICKWIYGKGAFDFNEMTDLPKELRDKLADSAMISLPETIEEMRADDGAAKFLFQLSDGLKIESVYIPDAARGKHTICLSTQVGCKFACKFCATGAIGFKRNLTSTEIVGQLYIAREYARHGGNEITNVVFMGMGEPLDNLDAALDAIKVMLSDVGFNLGHRKILISTIGFADGINKIMASGLRPKLAISLNAPDNELRAELMPATRKFPIESWLALVPEYAKHSKRYVTFEYVLLRDVNDSLEHANALVKLMKSLPAKINLIPYNRVAGSPFASPDNRIVLRFQSYLLANGITATIRQSKGGAIAGACGQLVAEECEVQSAK